MEHEAINFSLRGGAISVNVFLVNRLFYEKKYHQLAITGLTEVSTVNLALTSIDEEPVRWE